MTRNEPCVEYFCNIQHKAFMIPQIKTLIKSALVPAIAGLSLSCSSSPYEYENLYEDLPFQMAKVVRPSIPDRSISVADFGGIGDGTYLMSFRSFRVYFQKFPLSGTEFFGQYRNILYF